MHVPEENEVKSGLAVDKPQGGIPFVRLSLARIEIGQRDEKARAPLNGNDDHRSIRAAMNWFSTPKQFTTLHDEKRKPLPTSFSFLPADGKNGRNGPQRTDLRNLEVRAMTAVNIAVFSVFPQGASLENAIHALKVAGFRDQDFSILLQKYPLGPDLTSEKITDATEREAALPGLGVANETSLGWLAERSSLKIPGEGSILISDSLLSILSQIRLRPEVNGLMGALLSLGIPEQEAMRYQSRIKNGGILLLVDCRDRDWAGKAKDSLRSIGAENVCSTIESE